MGGLISAIRRLITGNNFIGKVVHIHGIPYTFKKRLGLGGYASVYSASASNGMPVAIKIIDLNGIPPDRSQALVKTYLNEVSLLEQLRQASRHVVVIHDFDFDPRFGVGYIVMELGGKNLRQLTKRFRFKGSSGSSLRASTVREYWRQAVSIVATLHAHSIVHMDLKPDNLILFGRLLKIADLGISKRIDALGRSRTGTPFFSAPEVMQDAPGFQRVYGTSTDIWSLGAILYFMVYGLPPTYHPFASNPPPGVRPYSDPAVIDILRRTLVLNPSGRMSISQLLHHPFTRF